MTHAHGLHFLATGHVTRSACAALSLLATTAVPLGAHAQAGQITAIYRFTGKTDGGGPFGGVVPDATGTILYGETSNGGGSVCTSKSGDPSGGCGTIYAYSRTTGLKVLFNFSGINGAYGESTLTLVGSTLYGTTNNGGANDAGVIFSIQTDGSNFKVLHQFNGLDGQNPTGPLRLGKGNVLYGVTPYGGAHGYGTLYSITPGGTYTEIHDFAGGNDGASPYSLLISATGILVGSTFQGGGTTKFCTSGCGVLFEYSPASGQYSLPYDYTTGGGVGGSIGGIGSGPTIYGASEYVVYSLSSSTAYTVLGTFSVLQLGAISSGPILTSDGTLIGVNGSGGNHSGGSIYSVANGVITELAGFGQRTGNNPYSQPILLPGNKLIGTASTYGLCATCGSIWEYTP